MPPPLPPPLPASARRYARPTRARAHPPPLTQAQNASTSAASTSRAEARAGGLARRRSGGELHDRRLPACADAGSGGAPTASGSEWRQALTVARLRGGGGDDVRAQARAEAATKASKTIPDLEKQSKRADKAAAKAKKQDEAKFKAQKEAKAQKAKEAEAKKAKEGTEAQKAKEAKK